MATLSGTQGMLLEEAVLYFLGTSLYRPVTSHLGDPTLWFNPTGLHVVGRGEVHQIDAIADFVVKPPFSPLQRLLVEAKFHRKDATGLEVIRNAVGVLKDVSEHWSVPPATLTASRTRPRQPRRPILRHRYHYQYAVISATGFTVHAQNYAFAQDISLIQVGHSRYFRPVLDAINRLTVGDFNATDANHLAVNPSSLRLAVRQRLQATDRPTTVELPVPIPAAERIKQIIAACHDIKLGALATLGSGSPVLLVANPEAVASMDRALKHAADDGQLLGRVRRDPEMGGWIVEYDGMDLFSFDIPPRFFRLLVEHQRDVGYNQPPETLTLQVAFADMDNRLGRSPRAGLGVQTFSVSWLEVAAFLAELDEDGQGDGGLSLFGPF